MALDFRSISWPAAFVEQRFRIDRETRLTAGKKLQLWNRKESKFRSIIIHRLTSYLSVAIDSKKKKKRKKREAQRKLKRCSKQYSRDNLSV